ncbi:MAG: hypothetical protein LBF65_01310 [Holosporales bacterium]|jgi:hypothetical protein|nr:hypothetical protein [Holosporales bacterium]
MKLDSILSPIITTTVVILFGSPTATSAEEVLNYQILNEIVRAEYFQLSDPGHLNPNFPWPPKAPVNASQDCCQHPYDKRQADIPTGSAQTDRIADGAMNREASDVNILERIPQGGTPCSPGFMKEFD